MIVLGHTLAPTSFDDFVLPAPFAGPPTWKAGDFNAGRSPSSTYFVFGRNKRPHLGIDIGKAADYGRDIGSASEGVVVRISRTYLSGAGRFVQVAHNVAGIITYTYYLHLSAVSVRVGDQVAKGQKIGEMGGSGFGRNRYYSPHLHTEIWQLVERPRRDGSDGVHLDPGDIYYQKPSLKSGHPGGTMRRRVITLQKRLRELGHNIRVDGQLGPMTLGAALAAMTSGAGLPEGTYTGPGGVKITIDRQ